MKKHNSSSRYWQERNDSKQSSKFNMLFEAVMSGTPVYQSIKDDPTLFFRKPDLHLICEEVCRDHYIISESTGDAILLEECLFWTERQLISEGILDKVFSAVQGIYEKIKDGIAKIITESSDAIKSFCEKVMNSKIVQAIRKKLGLDEKLSRDKFKKYIKIEDAKGKEVNSANEAIDAIKRGALISEATKLTKAEEAITDPKKIQEYIDKYTDYLNGKLELKNKKGEPLSKDYTKQRLKLFKNKLNELNGGKGEGKKELKEKEVGKVDNSSSKPEASGDTGGSANTGSSSGGGGDSSASKGKKKKSAGKIVIKEGIGEVAKNVGEQATSDEVVTAASTTAAVAEGGDAAKQAIAGGQGGGNAEAPKEEEKPKGFFNKLGSKLKSGIQSVTSAVSGWFAKQNKFVKMLIWGIIAVMAMFAIWWLVGAFIMPIITVIIHGTLAQSAGALFTIVMSGKTYYATFKAGKKAWQTGDDWGTFFMLLIGSVMATFALNGIANVGRNMMQQAAAKMVAQQQQGENGAQNNGNNQSGQNKGYVRTNKSGLDGNGNKDAGASGVRSGKEYDPDLSRRSKRYF